MQNLFRQDLRGERFRLMAVGDIRLGRVVGGAVSLSVLMILIEVATDFNANEAELLTIAAEGGWTNNFFTTSVELHFHHPH